MGPYAAKSGLLAWDSTLSSNDFHVSAVAFAEKWNESSSSSSLCPCLWVPSPKRPCVAALGVEGYLSLENVFLSSSREEDYEEDNQVQKEASCYSPDDTVDDASLVQCYDHEVHRYDFHIVYSSSYRVPVLYFRAYHIDGQPLALNDVEKDLSTNSAKLLMESKWTFITQEEHPYLNRPWYTLHPCGTSEWMKLLLSKGGLLSLEKYLVSWFSVVGQVFNLKIPVPMLTSFE